MNARSRCGCRRRSHRKVTICRKRRDSDSCRSLSQPRSSRLRVPMGKYSYDKGRGKVIEEFTNWQSLWLLAVLSAVAIGTLLLYVLGCKGFDRMACKHDLEGIVAKQKYNPLCAQSCRMAQDSQSRLFTAGTLTVLFLVGRTPNSRPMCFFGVLLTPHSHLTATDPQCYTEMSDVTKSEKADLHSCCSRNDRLSRGSLAALVIWFFAYSPKLSLVVPRLVR
jgi:hypothetical protein